MNEYSILFCPTQFQVHDENNNSVILYTICDSCRWSPQYTLATYTVTEVLVSRLLLLSPCPKVLLTNTHSCIKFRHNWEKFICFLLFFFRIVYNLVIFFFWWLFAGIWRWASLTVDPRCAHTPCTTYVSNRRPILECSPQELSLRTKELVREHEFPNEMMCNHPSLCLCSLLLLLWLSLSLFLLLPYSSNGTLLIDCKNHLSFIRTSGI